jgi:hypothetical protein
LNNRKAARHEEKQIQVQSFEKIEKESKIYEKSSCQQAEKIK